MRPDIPADDGIPPEEAEAGVHEAVAPLLQAREASVLSAEVADLVLVVAALAGPGADRLVGVEGVEVAGGARARVVLGPHPARHGELVHVEATGGAAVEAGQADPRAHRVERRHLQLEADFGS